MRACWCGAGRVSVWEGCRVVRVQDRLQGDQEEETVATSNARHLGQACVVTVAVAGPEAGEEGATGKVLLERHNITCRSVVVCTGGLFQEGVVASLLQVAGTSLRV